MGIFSSSKNRDLTRVLYQITSLGAGEGLARALNWATMATLPLLMSSLEEYGKVGLLVSVETLISGMFLFGLDRAILRSHSTGSSTGPLLRSVLTIWLSLAWIPLVATILLYITGTRSVFSIPLAPHVVIICASTAMLNLNLLCISIARAERHLTYFMRFRLLYSIVKFACVSLLAWRLGHSLCYAVGAIASGLSMLVYIAPFLKQRASGKADPATIGKLLMFGWPFVFIMISGNIFDYISRFLLEINNSTADVGAFTFASTMGGCLFILFAGLATYFEPRIYSHAADNVQCEEWLMLFTNTCLALASGAGALLLFSSIFLLPNLKPDYQAAMPILSVVMAAALLQPLYLQGNYRLAAHQSTKHLAGATFCSALASLILNVVLIPRSGIWGAAFAFFLSNLTLATTVLIVSIRTAKTKLPPYSALSWIIATIGTIPFLICPHRPIITSLTMAIVCLLSSTLLIRTIVAGGIQTT